MQVGPDGQGDGMIIEAISASHVEVVNCRDEEITIVDIKDHNGDDGMTMDEMQTNTVVPGIVAVLRTFIMFH